MPEKLHLCITKLHYVMPPVLHNKLYRNGGGLLLFFKLMRQVTFALYVSGLVYYSKRERYRHIYEISVKVTNC